RRMRSSRTWPLAPLQFLDGFRAAVYVGAGVLAAGAVLAVLLPRPLRPPRTCPSRQLLPEEGGDGRAHAVDRYNQGVFHGSSSGHHYPQATTVSGRGPVNGNGQSRYLE